MAAITEYFFDSSNNKNKIHVMKWTPENTCPIGILQISHGIGEHIGHYKEFASFMSENGFIVVGNDHLGHGMSFSDPSDRGVFDDKNGWKKVCCDMHRIYEKEHAENPGLPYFLLGHSLGSFLARSFLIYYPSILSGCILSGTGYFSRFSCLFGKAFIAILSIFSGKHGKSKFLNDLCFGTYNIEFKPTKTKFDWVSRDEAVTKEVSDSDKGKFIPALSLLRDMFGGILFMESKRNLSRMEKNTPVLFFSGEKDPVGKKGTGVRKSYKSFTDAGCTDIAIKIYPGGRHEMLHEINKDEVFSDVINWIKKHI